MPTFTNLEPLASVRIKLNDAITLTEQNTASIDASAVTVDALVPAVALNTAKVSNAAHTGDATGSTALTLATVNANVGTFGSAANVAVVTANGKGLTTAVSSVAIAIPAAQITDSTVAGRSLLTAIDAPAQRTALGLGTLATQSGTVSGSNTGDQTSIVGITGTKAQFNTSTTDGDFQFVGDAPSAHTHLLAAGATDVTVLVADLNSLDDGLTTALHFHDADRARGVHTGTQLAATISDFSTATAATAAVTANTAKVSNATHTGDVTGATALTIAAGAVTLAKQANMATGSLVYRKTALAGAPEIQTLATLKTDLGLTGTNSGDQTSIAGLTGTKLEFNTAASDGDFQFVGDAPTAHTHLLAAGATDVTVTALNLNILDDGLNTTLHFHDADRARANHTGTQAVGTITGLAAIATSGSAADLSAGILPALRFDDTSHGARAGGTLHANAVAAGAAGFMTGADKTKLDGVATGANLYVHPNHTGDAASVGDGAITLATVNANVGSFGSATEVAAYTVNAKGLATASSSVPIAIPISQLTQSAAASGQVPQWNGTTWVPASVAAGGVVAPVTSRIRSSVNQAIAAGSTFMDLTFNTAAYQVNGTFWTSGATITIPEAGYFSVMGHVTFDGSALIATATANMQMLVNGTLVMSTDETQVLVNAPASLMTYAQRLFAAGDTIKLQVKHTNASAINVLAQGDYSPDIILTKLTGAKGDTGTATAPVTTTFNSTGAFQAYTIPAGAAKLIITCIGPGGNGGAGFSRAAGSAGGGGGGGGGGGITTTEVIVSRLGVSTLQVFPGAGSGGNISYVSIAANSIAQNLICRAAAGANAGVGTGAAAGTAGAAGVVSTLALTGLASIGMPFFAVGQIGVAGGVQTGAVGVAVAWGATGVTVSSGAGGAGCTTTNFAGGDITGAGAVVATVAGGIAAGGAGGAGVAYASRMMYTGGSGGGSNNTATGGVGGAGAIGSGGGGGGVGVTGGAGGLGGAGLVMITATF